MSDNDPTPGETPTAGGTPATFESWLENQPDEAKALIASHTNGLKTALQREREQRQDLAKEVKKLARAAETGSEARDALEQLSGRLDAAERKTAFYETVAGQTNNPRLAWLAADSAGLVDKSGTVKLEALKAEFPELFAAAKVPPPPANAGNGAGQNGAGQPDMNAFIRQSAGRT